MLHHILMEPVYFCYGVAGIWDYLGLSWKHVLQSFVVGLIIKLGYWLAHQFMSPRTQKKGNAMATLSAVGSIIDDK